MTLLSALQVNALFLYIKPMILGKFSTFMILQFRAWKFEARILPLILVKTYFTIQMEQAAPSESVF
jgi:hypothetical protein